MSFDIAKFDSRTGSETGTDMTVVIPKPPFSVWLDEKGKPLTITMKGRNSAKFRDLQRQAQLRSSDMSARNIPRTDADEENDRFITLCAMTVGWSFDTLDGQPFPFNEENVRKLWADERWPWLRTQAMNHVLNEGNHLIF